MNLSGNTVLVTGGASGIGLAIARRFLDAGSERRVALADAEPRAATHEEIAINFEAPVHLTRLFAAHLARQQAPAIVNVTSGLSFVPLAQVPIYCATKAAMHSFTLSLRHQLRMTPIEVIEVIPPAVNTDLGGPGLQTFGVNVDEFADAVMTRIAAGEQEVAYGFAAESSRAGRDTLDALFARMNAPRSPCRGDVASQRLTGLPNTSMVATFTQPPLP